jgi:Na+-transporting NADH:ubiquinone oxidoreductase subunit F
MAEVLLAVIIIVGLSCFLAALLIVADALLLNYGECVITINEEEEKKVEGGKSLLNSLMEHEIFIPSACGGRGTCGLCKVKVGEGGGPLLPTEMPHLTEDEVKGNVRLSCQVKVRSDMRIELPEEILSLKQYQTTVQKIVDLNYDTRLIRLKLVDPPEIEFKPGQYIQLETPPYGKTPEPVYRAYSVASSASEKGALDLIIRRVPEGICTTYCFEIMKEGDPATINGPYGDFFLREAQSEIIFIAGGSGIAPIRSILFQMAEQKIERKATFFYGANDLRDLYLVEEMKEFQKKVPDFTYVPCIAQEEPDDVWEGETGLVTQVVDRHVESCKEQEVYLCGSPAMIDAAVKLLAEKGLTEERTFYDKFA